MYSGRSAAKSRLQIFLRFDEAIMRIRSQILRVFSARCTDMMNERDKLNGAAVGGMGLSVEIAAFRATSI